MSVVWGLTWSHAFYALFSDGSIHEPLSRQTWLRVAGFGQSRAGGGVRDGGAHLSFISDASFSTYLMAHWVQDRPHDRLSVEGAVKRLSADNARFIGLNDRGELARGQRADINRPVAKRHALHRQRPAVRRQALAAKSLRLPPHHGGRRHD